MSGTKDFLVEIGTEELPPRALKRLSQKFGEGILSALRDASLEHGEVSLFATPRRLAVKIQGLTSQQADRKVELRGPPAKVAFDKDGKPTRAAQAFADKCGISVDALQKIETDKGTWLVHSGIEQGKSAASLLPDIIAQSLDQLPIPKRMRWGTRDAEFVRPVHWVVLLLDAEVIPATVFGLESNNRSYGHRFHAPEAFVVPSPAAYEETLKHKHVIASFDQRQAIIRKAIDAAAKQAGGTVVTDAALLDEVTALVEWPVAVSASFDERFLALPEEVLIETLQAHQRYFAIRAKDKLLPAFITISNIESRDSEQVRLGNERVVMPRLADAAFFWDNDRSKTLEARGAALDSVIFQKKLGTLADKTTRVEKLARILATALGADSVAAARAARLSKCDLLSEMVGEFPSLQGTMGRYYALHDKEDSEVAAALEEQYLPRYAGDALPLTAIGCVLSIAEKLDTIAGIFAIGKRPSGTRDPFGLRRSSLGILRVLIEKEKDIDLRALIEAAVKLQPVSAKQGALVDEIYSYLLERLRAYYLDDDSAGFTPQMFDAVAARQPSSPLDFQQRLIAVREFASLDAAQALSAANKRIANILRSADEEIPPQVQEDLLTENAEKSLYQQMDSIQKEVMPLLEGRDYRAALNRLATLRPVVDQFFDDVMVMANDDSLRRNRLALLGQLRNLFMHTADLSRLQVG